MSHTDLELLARYTRQHAEDAFAEIVRRHLGLVYSAALRQVGSPQLAEEISQSAFIDLARQAARLKPDTILTAWLYQVTRRTAVDVVRREASRQLRESRWSGTTEMIAMNASAADWTHIEPLLDEAMHALDETDRTAVLLRYFENKSLREVGATLGTSENAAQKRLARAVERLREFFAKRGVIVGGSGLVVVLSANAVQAAPTVLAKTATAVVIANSATASTSTLALLKGALKMLAWTNTKTGIVVSAVAVTLAVVGITVEVKEARAGENADESWRSASLTWQQVGQTAPQVKILPTKFQPPVYHILTSDGIKRGGINVSVREIVWAAYRCGPGRMVFAAGEPQERYDFISTLRRDTEEALQREVKKTLGLTGRWENVETNILALKVRNPDAPGLEPTAWKPSEFGNLPGGHIHCFGQPLSWKPPMPPWGLTKQLERLFQMPIVDETGLTGSYNLDLRWKVKRDPTANQEAVKQALIDQLGLELVPMRKSVAMLIVEKVQ